MKSSQLASARQKKDIGHRTTNNEQRRMNNDQRHIKTSSSINSKVIDPMISTNSSVSQPNSNGPLAKGTSQHHPERAVHHIRLSALRHNYSFISSSASRQQCGVIVVVKADGYGHGSTETALHLADYSGVDAFAVATVDEGVALRKALNSNSGTPINNSSTCSMNNQKTKVRKIVGRDLFQPPPSVEIASASHGNGGCDVSTIASIPIQIPVPIPISSQIGNGNVEKQARSPNIRILVLGPPTNLPNDFALYQQFNLELMCSGPQMARALMEWVANCDARRIQEVEEAATYQKDILLKATDDNDSTQLAKHKQPGQASTLNQVEGAELGKELRQILLKKESLERNIQNRVNGSAHSDSNTVSSSQTHTHMQMLTQQWGSIKPSISTERNGQGLSQISAKVPYKGIEDAAKTSRAREKAAAKVVAQTAGEDDDDEDGNDDTGHEQSFGKHSANGAGPLRDDNDAEDSAVVSAVSSATVKDAAAKVANSAMKKGVAPASARRKIRWHALVDSGMGRLGFKSVEDGDEDDDEEEIPLDKLPAPLLAHTNKYPKWKVGPHRDTVSIIKAMTDAEIYGSAPIEFFGLCTHMAEASSDSNYTNEQMARFKSLLKRVRQAGIAVPTISTDNSSALLTTNLNHFNPAELLVQKNVTNSLGFVRTGGGIFGQRPAFPQLNPVSTLTASVSHVAVLQEGQSVGYDRAYIAPRSVRIATLTIGFADGYPRDLGNGRGKVSIRGEVFPVAGKVCMDMMMVDLGSADDVGSAGANVCVGDRAVLWGPDQDNSLEGQIRLQDIAEELNTTQSALTCGLNKVRVQRQYVD